MIAGSAREPGGRTKLRVAIMFGVVLVVVVAGVVSERLLQQGGHQQRQRDNVPYVPKSQTEVVERLPSRALTLDLERLRKTSGEMPRDPDRAADFATRSVTAARATGDPRLLGQARAALAPWWDAPDAPPRIVFLRAVIRQSLHDFDGALADLDRLASAGTADPQVWLTRGVVLTVTGRYEAARSSCQRVSAALAASVCEATVDSLTGRARDAYARLSARAEDARGEERAWALSSLAEIAIRAGDDAAAERHFKAALALDPEERYTLGAYADLLLDLKRPEEVISVIGARLPDDGLLLRSAIALDRVGSPDAAAKRATLAERHAAAKARGDVVHRREEARFELTLGKDAPRALELALANFAVQKEPWDVRLVLEAATVAGKPEAAHQAADFVRTTGAEEPRLRALLAPLRASGARP